VTVVYQVARVLLSASLERRVFGLWVGRGVGRQVVIGRS